MFSRLLAALMALLLLAASSAAGAGSVVCRMHGGVHKSCCCCHKTQAEPGGDWAKLQKDHRCCEVRLPDGAQAGTGAATVALDGPVQLPLAVFEPMHPQVVSRPSRELALPVGSRAPPSRAGPALFVWNCSYLI